MPKLSVIIPVNNEEDIIAQCLCRIEHYVDEIVIIDGSPNGASTDGTIDILHRFEKVKYLSKQYARGQAWDREAQLQDGLKACTSDYCMFISADMMVEDMGIVRDTFDAGKIDFLYVGMINFWYDIQHVRSDPDIINWRLLVFPVKYGKEYISKGKIKLPNKSRTVNVVSSMIYHLGWIRPFASQVAKHIRHVYNGSWGETGFKLMQLGEDAIEAWAIHHVLNYNIEDGSEIAGVPASLTEVFAEWSYKTGLEDFQKVYAAKHDGEFYTTLVSNVPHELIL